MTIFKKYAIALLVLVLLLAGLESVRSFFMANVIVPIALVCWAVWRVIASVDQIVYWVILIIVGFLLVIRLIPNSSDDKIKPAYKNAYKTSNRVAYWKALLMGMVVEKEDAENLRSDMKNLLASVIHDTEKSISIDLKELTASGKIALSPDAQRFLFPPSQVDRKRSTYSRFKGLSFLPAWFRRTALKMNHQDIRSMDEILKWIEMEMEINNDE